MTEISASRPTIQFAQSQRQHTLNPCQRTNPSGFLDLLDRAPSFHGPNQSPSAKRWHDEEHSPEHADVQDRPHDTSRKENTPSNPNAAALVTQPEPMPVIPAQRHTNETAVSSAPTKGPTFAIRSRTPAAPGATIRFESSPPAAKIQTANEQALTAEAAGQAAEPPKQRNVIAKIQPKGEPVQPEKSAYRTLHAMLPLLKSVTPSSNRQSTKGDSSQTPNAIDDAAATGPDGQLSKRSLFVGSASRSGDASGGNEHGSSDPGKNHTDALKEGRPGGHPIQQQPDTAVPHAATGTVGLGTNIGKAASIAQQLASAWNAAPNWQSQNVAAATRSLGGLSSAPITTLEVQLDPKNLGRITATLTLSGSQLKVGLSAENEEVAHRLDADRSEIEHALRRLGFEVERTDILPAKVEASASQISTDGAQGQSSTAADSKADSPSFGTRQEQRDHRSTGYESSASMQKRSDTASIDRPGNSGVYI